MVRTEGVLRMAKKKTAGPGSTAGATPAPSTTRRRAAGNATSAGSAQASPVATFDNGNSSIDAVDSAADRSSASRPSTNGFDPSFDEIAEAAYQRYLSRGGDHGRDFDDWVEAERDLRSRR
jgi:hypothetical protein